MYQPMAYSANTRATVDQCKNMATREYFAPAEPGATVFMAGFYTATRRSRTLAPGGRWVILAAGRISGNRTKTVVAG